MLTGNNVKEEEEEPGEEEEEEKQNDLWFYWVERCGNYKPRLLGIVSES